MNIAVIAPHPDDETLGCGGTILKHVESGDKVTWIIVTTITEELGFSKEKILEREIEIEKVAGLYGFENVIKLSLPTMLLDTISTKSIVDSLSKCIKEVEAEVLYIPNYTDVHSDHKIISDAAISCTKWFRYPTIKKVYAYETLSETEFGINTGLNSFNPNVFVNIEKFIDKKVEIMNVYKSEVGALPFPRSNEAIRSLAIVRGVTAGYKYAESFMLLKEVID